MDQASLAAMIDHTLLKPEATRGEVEGLCAEARRWDFAAVCVNAGWLPVVREALAGSGVKSCVVVGFPLGATSTAAKAAETRLCVEGGADEVDMVLNIGLLRSGETAALAADVDAVREACGATVTLKVIIESALLSPEEIATATAVSVRSGADFVKTSTGFNPAGGASEEAVRRIAHAIDDAGRHGVGIKASGGIRDLATATRMVEAGATRLGMSASVAVLQELAAR